MTLPTDWRDDRQVLPQPSARMAENLGNEQRSLHLSTLPCPRDGLTIRTLTAPTKFYFIVSSVCVCLNRIHTCIVSDVYTPLCTDLKSWNPVWDGSDAKTSLSGGQVRLVITGDSMAGQLYRAAQCGLTRLGASLVPRADFKGTFVGGLANVTLETSVYSLPAQHNVSDDRVGSGDVGRGARFEMAFLNVLNANKNVMRSLNRSSDDVRHPVVAHSASLLHKNCLPSHQFRCCALFAVDSVAPREFWSIDLQ